MGEFPVGGMSGRDAEMRVIGVQITPKSRRWEDTAKELSHTRKQLCQDITEAHSLSSTEYGSLPSGS